HTSRAPWLPEVPTTAESGFPAIQVSSWYGLMGRAGTPAPVLAKITKDVREIMQSAEMKKRYDEIGAYAIGNSPEEFGSFIKSEAAKWVGLVKKVGIQPQ